MEAATRGMSRLGITFDRILTSPLKRAQETARIVADGTGGQAGLRIEPLLVGGCSAEALLGLLAADPPAARILVVGHQPDMGRIAADLTGSEGPLPFGRGTLGCLELPDHPAPGAAELVFLIPAELLARAG